MKVERNVIAKIFECDEADVKCDNCARSETDLCLKIILQAETV